MSTGSLSFTLWRAESEAVHRREKRQQKARRAQRQKTRKEQNTPALTQEKRGERCNRRKAHSPPRSGVRTPHPVYVHLTRCMYTPPGIGTPHPVYVHRTRCMYTSRGICTHHAVYVHPTRCTYTPRAVRTPDHRTGRTLRTRDSRGEKEHRAG